MTDWDAIAETGKEPDTLEKVIIDLSDAVLPLANGMKKIHTREQLRLFRDEMLDIVNRINYMIVKVGRNGTQL